MLLRRGVQPNGFKHRQAESLGWPHSHTRKGMFAIDPKPLALCDLRRQQRTLPIFVEIPRPRTPTSMGKARRYGDLAWRPRRRQRFIWRKYSLCITSFQKTTRLYSSACRSQSAESGYYSQACESIEQGMGCEVHHHCAHTSQRRA